MVRRAFLVSAELPGRSAFGLDEEKNRQAGGFSPAPLGTVSNHISNTTTRTLLNYFHAQCLAKST